MKTHFNVDGKSRCVGGPDNLTDSPDQVTCGRCLRLMTREQHRSINAAMSEDTVKVANERFKYRFKLGCQI